MNSGEKITLVVATDNHYIVLLAALIKSIEVNHNSKELINVYIVGDGLTQSNIAKFSNSFNSPFLASHWLQMDQIIPSTLKLPMDYSSYPKNIYLRLFIPYFVPANVHKAIYLDVDMIVQCDIRNLWNIDLNEYIVGAVPDASETIGNSYSGIPNYRNLNLDPKSKYFNTGLLLINLSKWRKEDITVKVINCIAENTKYATLPDQYGLNVVLYRKWLELERTWNVFSDAYLDAPNIIHFAHRKPIYKSYKNRIEYKHLFFRYLGLTEWKHFKEIGEFRRYAKKLYNVIEKLKW